MKTEHKIVRSHLPGEGQELIVGFQYVQGGGYRGWRIFLLQKTRNSGVQVAPGKVSSQYMKQIILQCKQAINGTTPITGCFQEVNGKNAGQSHPGSPSLHGCPRWSVKAPSNLGCSPSLQLLCRHHWQHRKERHM